MDRFTQKEQLILRDLFRADSGLSMYTFWLRYRISEVELSKCLHRLIKNNIVKAHGSHITLTTDGQRLVGQMRDLFADLGAKSWREVPEVFTQQKLGIGEPITPNLSKIDESLLSEKVRKRMNEKRKEG